MRENKKENLRKQDIWWDSDWWDSDRDSVKKMIKFSSKYR